MRHAVRHERFTDASELVGLILEEAAEVSPMPFAELLEEPAGQDRAHWLRQLTALRVLERLNAAAELCKLTDILRSHPFKAIAEQAAHLRGD